MLEAPACDVTSLQATSYSSVESYRLEWKRLNGDIEEEHGADGMSWIITRWSGYCSVTPVGRKILVFLTPAG